jgi:hypothetical protein
MEILVGYTGFVGGNIAEKKTFDLLCNSKNISDSFGTNPELLVYSGVPAEMFLANTNPEADKAIIENAIGNIKKINPKRLVLISTIAVLDNPLNADEDVVIDETKLTAYGLNRLYLEKAIVNIIPQSHILRLPALFGNGIKKNFIYDMINILPAMLNQAKYRELSCESKLVADNYQLQDNGFYKLKQNPNDIFTLKEEFKRLGFSALNFTDSRSVFQYYNLSNMWKHIQTVILNNIPLFHTAVEPVSASEIYEYVNGQPFENILAKVPFNYDYKTKYSSLFGGKNGYIFDKEQVLEEIKTFVR